MRRVKLKNAFILMSALVLAACQPPAPTSNIPNIPQSPTIEPTALIVSSAENINASNAPNANVKANQPTVTFSPKSSPTPKLAISPTASPTSKYKNYTARGIVKSLDAANRSITIDHEDIGDYMVGMEMPFPVVNADSLKNLQVGDQVEFVLETGVGVERIVSIRKRK